MKFWLTCFLSFFIAFHIVTITHEMLGHGLTAVLFGGSINEVYMSWMGASGYVHTTLEGTSAWQDFLFQWSGILVTLFLAFLLWQRQTLFVWTCVTSLF